MQCFKDKTFCPFNQCLDFTRCDRALTANVKAEAAKWMKEPSIAYFSVGPECFRSMEMQLEDEDVEAPPAKSEMAEEIRQLEKDLRATRQALELAIKAHQHLAAKVDQIC